LAPAVKRSSKMRSSSWSNLPCGLYFAATALAGTQMFATAGKGAQEQPAQLKPEIADIERQIDAIEADSIAGIPSLLVGRSTTPARSRQDPVFRQGAFRQSQRSVRVLPYAANGLSGGNREHQSGR